MRAWIDQGAEAPADERPQPDPREHWAFRPPVRPAVPGSTTDAGWVRNPIDAFLAASTSSTGWSRSPPPPPAMLLRRVYLDLTGLAPTPEELRAFLADPSDEPTKRVVDRLLASPRYGERWGRHWMDVWRYSDWDGYGAEVRESQPHIWRWRDWIVESLNADKGYDRMVVEMLAADEAAPATRRHLRATGFLVRNWYKFNRNVWLDDTVEHTAKAFLGLTHQLRPLPRPQVRPDRPGGLLPLPRLLRAARRPHRPRARPARHRPRTAWSASTTPSRARPTFLSSAATRRRPGQGQRRCTPVCRRCSSARASSADRAGRPGPTSVVPRPASRSSRSRRARQARAEIEAARGRLDAGREGPGLGQATRRRWPRPAASWHAGRKACSTAAGRL